MAFLFPSLEIRTKMYDSTLKIKNYGVKTRREQIGAHIKKHAYDIQY